MVSIGWVSLWLGRRAAVSMLATLKCLTAMTCLELSVKTSRSGASCSMLSFPLGLVVTVVVRLKLLVLTGGNVRLVCCVSAWTVAVPGDRPISCTIVHMVNLMRVSRTSMCSTCIKPGV